MLFCFLFPAAGLVTPFVALMAPGELTPWGLAMSALLLLTSILSPFAYYLAFRFVVLGKYELSKRAAAVLGGLAAWTLVGNTYFVLNIASPGFALRSVLLMAVFPALAAMHIVFMAKREQGELGVA
jgi:hypothetical protein